MALFSTQSKLDSALYRQALPNCGREAFPTCPDRFLR